VGGIALHQRLFTRSPRRPSAHHEVSRDVRNDRIFCVLLISGFFSFSLLLLLAYFAFIYCNLPISRTVSLGLVGTWKSFAIEGGLGNS
jgi:hypothetical protein